jgi:hypothetical protein
MCDEFPLVGLEARHLSQDIDSQLHLLPPLSLIVMRIGVTLTNLRLMPAGGRSATFVPWSARDGGGGYGEWWAVVLASIFAPGSPHEAVSSCMTEGASSITVC